MSIFQAIHNLTNGAEFTLVDDDLSSVIFNDVNVKKPTQKDIDAELIRIESEVASKAAAKEALLQKLGISSDEAKLLLS